MTQDILSLNPPPGLLKPKTVHPLAQTFYCEEDVYLTKIGLFFSRVSSTSGVSIEIRPAETGVPNIQEIIPGSVVYKSISEMAGQASTDASVETQFVFEEPVYLRKNTNYAFVVKSAAKNEYFLWSSRVGDYVLGTTTARISKNPENTAMFKSQSGLLYTPEVDDDLMYILYRAGFSASQATVTFKAAKPQPKALGNNTLSGTAGSSEIVVYSPGHGFLVNDRVHMSGLVDGERYNGILGESLKGSRIVTAVDGNHFTFNADSDADSDIRFGNQFLRVSKQLKFNTVQLNVADYIPGSGIINYSGDFTTSKSLAGTETPYAKTTGVSLKNNVDRTLQSVHGIFTDSNESLNSITESAKISAVMKKGGTQNRIAPYIDVQRAGLYLIQNLIDNQDSSATSGYNVPIDFVPETAATGGTALSKHITKPVTLASGATGLKVLYGANVPSEASIDLYYRTTLNGTDSDILAKPFVYAASDNNPPNDTDPNKYREYRHTIGGSFANSLREFNQYQIKLVMNSTNSSKFPRIKDLRTIALAADQAI